MQKSNPIRLFLTFALVGFGLISTGCASQNANDDEVESVRRTGLSPEEDAQRLYDRGDYMLRNGNYSAAIQLFEQLETRYPLNENTRQAQINLIFAHFKRKNKELAIDAANQFILENPVHPKLDYVYYLLGLVHFDKENNRVENLFRVDKTKRPQKDAQDSMEYFLTLLQKYPDSEYANDAKQRVIYLRERLANHDLHVAQYYAERGIHIAAVNRAKVILEEYPDTTAARSALAVLESSYRNLGMNDLADDTRRIRQSN